MLNEWEETTMFMISFALKAWKYIAKKADSYEHSKAFSQNMMHESMEIAEHLYGNLAGEIVRRIISHLGKVGN